jgi:MraZ protein
MMELLGEFEVTLDAKGRFLLPANIRKRLPEDYGGEFIIARGEGPYLNLFPKVSWTRMMETLGKVNHLNKDSADYLRVLFKGATPMEFDSAGRLLVPPGLKKHGALEKEVMLNCVRDRIEIWNKERYDKFFDDMTEERFRELSEKVTGGPREGQ